MQDITFPIEGLLNLENIKVIKISEYEDGDLYISIVTTEEKQNVENAVKRYLLNMEKIELEPSSIYLCLKEESSCYILQTDMFVMTAQLLQQQLLVGIIGKANIQFNLKIL